MTRHSTSEPDRPTLDCGVGALVPSSTEIKVDSAVAVKTEHPMSKNFVLQRALGLEARSRKHPPIF